MSTNSTTLYDEFVGFSAPMRIAEDVLMMMRLTATSSGNSREICEIMSDTTNDMRKQFDMMKTLLVNIEPLSGDLQRIEQNLQLIEREFTNNDPTAAIVVESCTQIRNHRRSINRWFQLHGNR